MATVSINRTSGLTKPGEVGEILALIRLKSLSLDYKGKLKSHCFFLQVTLFLQIIFVYGKADWPSNCNQCSWIMSLYQIRNCKIYGFRSITWVWLNQIKRNLDMLLWSTKCKISTILTDFTFDVPELCPFMKYEIVKVMVMP